MLFNHLNLEIELMLSEWTVCKLKQKGLLSLFHFGTKNVKKRDITTRTRTA